MYVLYTYGQSKTLCNNSIQKKKKRFGLIFESELIFGAFMEVYEPSFFSVVLTFCSLRKNEIKADGARELAGALQVNQSLQQLK